MCWMECVDSPEQFGDSITELLQNAGAKVIILV